MELVQGDFLLATVVVLPEQEDLGSARWIV